MALASDLMTTGLMKFYSREEVRRYMKLLVDYYQRQATDYGDRLGLLLRQKEAAKQQGNNSAKPAQPRGWVRMGPLLVNTSDPLAGMTEAVMQIHDELKQKLAKATEALKSYEELASVTIPEGGVYALQLKNGLPERIVVDMSGEKRTTFSYSAEFRLV